MSTTDREGLEQRRRWRNQDAARMFRRSPEFERLLALRDSERLDDRALFEKLAHGRTKVALGLYEHDKERAREGGANVEEE